MSRKHSHLRPSLLAHLAAAAAPLLTAMPAHGQQDAAFQQYWKIEPQWCPAAVGRTPELAINAAFQSHAAGFEDAGSTLYAGVDMAFKIGKTRHGVGAAFVNDVFGLFSQKLFCVQYAYHLKLWGGTLSFGRSSLGRLPGLSAIVTLPAVLEKESP